MIRTFHHKGLEKFFKTESKAGIQTAHGPRLKRQLARLNVATMPEDMNVPGWSFHGLKGEQKGRYSVSVNGNWRLTFEFEGRDVVLVDYEDYH